MKEEFFLINFDQNIYPFYTVFFFFTTNLIFTILTLQQRKDLYVKPVIRISFPPRDV